MNADDTDLTDLHRFIRTLHPLGKITKTHGYNGAVVLVSERRLGDDLEEHLDEVFVVIDGLQVPFPVEEFVLLTDTSARLQLEFVGNRDEALKLTGCEVFAAVGLDEQKPEAEGLEQWTGFTVYDSKYGKIGVIQEIEDYNGNLVMQIDGKMEILISLYPELVTRVDHDEKNLYITAPDGYF